MTVHYDFVKSLALHFDSIYDLRELGQKVRCRKQQINYNLTIYNLKQFYS